MSTEPTAPCVEVKVGGKPFTEAASTFLLQADLWSPLVVDTQWEKDYLNGYLIILGVPCEILLNGTDRGYGKFLTYVRVVNQEGDDYVPVSL